jgi:hypothetical protein
MRAVLTEAKDEYRKVVGERDNLKEIYKELKVKMAENEATMKKDFEAEKNMLK